MEAQHGMKDILLFCKKYMKLHRRQLCFYILLETAENSV